MTEPKAHEKLTLRRIYDAPPERVFRAWTDPAELARWNVPADGWTIEVLEVDLRVGGHYRATFGPPGEEPYLETDEYREIVRPKRLVFTETISRGGTVLTQTLCTVEFTTPSARFSTRTNRSGDTSRSRFRPPFSSSVDGAQNERAG